MKKTLKELAFETECELLGNESAVITGAAGLLDAKPGDITFVANPKYTSLIDKTKASAIIISNDHKEIVKKTGISALISKTPYLTYAKILTMLYSETARHPKGISQKSSISKTANIGKNVSIGDNAIIEDGSLIGDGTIIYPNCYIGYSTKIGNNCLIYPNVTIREKIIIGNNIIIHSGTVIGSDGFGYAPSPNGIFKIPQIGIVQISDDVEIGANVTIDRATTGKTFIGKGSKIDNLVQIAHNVTIGENTFIIAQAGISGSTKIGSGVTIAGQAGLAGHLTIEDGAVIAAQAGVMGNVKAKEVVSGYPARPHRQAMKIYALIQKLPELFNEIKKLRKE